MNVGTVGLVLSGGGARGAWQYAAERYLREAYGFKWDIIAGVSVGALNGSMLAQNEPHVLDKMWRTVTRKDVMSGNALLSALTIPFGKSHLYSNRPLYNTIREYVDPRKVSIPFYIGCVSMRTGEYLAFHADEHLFNTGDLEKDIDAWSRAILASTTIPLIWGATDVAPEVKEVVDGGVRTVTPLGDVLQHDPDLVVIIECQPQTMGYMEGSTNRFLRYMNRSMGIMNNEVMRRDVSEYLRINRLVKQAEENGITLYKESGEPYKRFNTILISPSSTQYEGYGDATNFDRSLLDRYLIDGETTAREVMQMWNGTEVVL